ncbi:MAG: amidohydrolase [Acidobacteria bacterium]|nr:amidohydrolase [Acidobacteriota bacterium]
MTSYNAISASSHLEVGSDVWRDHVAAEHRDAVPAIDLRADAAPSGGDPQARLAEMDRDGVDAEVLFPAAIGSRSFSSIESEAQMAATRGYNDWLSEEFCSAAPDRLLGVALLPATRVQDAVDEITRLKSMPGIRAVILQQWPNGSGAPIPADDRFWEAAVDLDMPLVAWRTFGGGSAAAPRPPSTPPPMPLALTLCTGSCTTQSQLIYDGVFDRFPSLQILFAGLGAGWVLNQIEQADDMFRRHRFWGGYAADQTQANYFPKHCKWTFTRDALGVSQRHEIGLDNVLWSSNFPHEDNDFPESRQQLDKQLAGLPADEARALAAGNAVNFFRLS